MVRRLVLASLTLAVACRGVQVGPSVCGNGKTEDGEQCDYGPKNDGSRRCRVDCTFKACGDGVLDLGQAIDTDNDGLGDVPEVCDRAIPSDPPCRNDCRAFSSCGNGVVDPPTEQCDTGPNRSDTAPGACRTTCQRARCGDGVQDPGEECDDSNTVSGDGCDSNCTTTRCGNGVASPGEQCDDGNAVDVDACLPSCQHNGCAGGVSPAGTACLVLRTQAMRLPITLENRPNGVTVGDFDADGSGDVAVTTGLSCNVDVLFGNGAGVLTPPAGQDSWNIALAPIGLAAGDVDGSGRAGLFVLSGAVGGATATAMLNKGPGLLDRVWFDRFWASDPLVGPGQLGLADLDRSGSVDLVYSGAGQLGVARVIPRDAGVDPSVELFSRGVFTTPRLLATGDLDGDGHADVVFSNLAGGLEVVDDQDFFTNGPLTTTQLEGPMLGLVAITLADLDGDGIDELIAAVNPPVGPDSIRVFFNSNPASSAPFFERTVELPASFGPTFLAASPTRGIVYADSQRVGLRRSQSGAFAEEATFRVYEGDMFIRAIALGKLDSDGVSDIAFVADGDFEHVGVLVTSP